PQLALDPASVLDEIRQLHSRVAPYDAGRPRGAGIRIERVIEDVLQQTVSVVANQVEDGLWTGAVVKNSSAAADHDFAVLPRRPRERRPRREGVVIVKIILPVIAQSQGDLQVWPQFELVLDESSQNLLHKNHVSVP